MSILSPGELEVIQVLWEHGEMKPTEIQEKFPRPINNSALRFGLRILLDKGHVTRRKIGRAYHYKAKTPRHGAFGKMAKRMADAFTKGSTAGLIAELIRTEDLTDAEIRDLRKLAAAKARPGRKTIEGGEGS